MQIEILAAVLAVLMIAFPYLLHLYVERLPVAPTCPSCRAVTRAAGRRWSALHLVPTLAATSVGECARCGWRGRMRWRWAPKSVDSRGAR